MGSRNLVLLVLRRPQEGYLGGTWRWGWTPGAEVGNLNKDPWAQPWLGKRIASAFQMGQVITRKCSMVYQDPFPNVLGWVNPEDYGTTSREGEEIPPKHDLNCLPTWVRWAKLICFEKLKHCDISCTWVSWKTSCYWLPLFLSSSSSSTCHHPHHLISQVYAAPC